VWPIDAEVILKRFNTTTSEQAEGPETCELGDGNSWNDLRKILDDAVMDKQKAEAKRVGAALHSLQVQNELLHHKNNGLRAALTTKQKHVTKSKVLDLQQREEYHGGAVLWSPRKIREARAHERVKQQEDEHKKLQKSHNKELKAAATLYKKKMTEEAKVVRQLAREHAAKESAAKAEELAAASVLKKQQRNTATLQKFRNTPNKGKPAASQSAVQKSTKRRRVASAGSGAAPALPPLSPKQQRVAAQSRCRVNISSTKVAQGVVYYYSIKSHDNNNCIWLYSLVFAAAEM
jgi:hypothetical protein